MTTANPTPLPHEDNADPSFAPMQVRQLPVIDDDPMHRTHDRRPLADRPVWAVCDNLLLGRFSSFR